MASPAIAPSAPRPRGRSRAGLAILAAAFAVLAGAPAVASAATRSWSGPISLDKTGGQQPLYDVACPTATLCVAVDGIGQVVTFDPTAPGTPTLTKVSNSSSGSEVTVACPSATQCTNVVGDYEVTFDPTAPGTQTTAKIGSSGSFRYLACASTSQCTAIDQNYPGSQVTFNPSTGTVISGPTAPDPSGVRAVACASTSRCTVVDSSGNEVTFNPATGAVTSGPTAIDGTTPLAAVACPATNQCTAVDSSGNEVTFDPATGAVTGGPAAINGTAGLQAIDCPSATQCTAIDYSGNEVTFTPSTGAVVSGPTAIDADGGGLNAVSCPTSSQCTAVDATGREVTFTPTTGAVTSGPATIDGVSNLTAVACPSASQCTAVDLAGQEVTFNPSTGAKTSGPTVIDPGGYYLHGGLSGVACPSVNLCAAVDNAYFPSDGFIVIFNPITGDVIQSIDADPYGFTGVACASTTVCAAVDYAAGEVTFNPSTGATSGVTVIDPDPYGDTLVGIACPSVSQCTTLNIFQGTETTFDPNTPGSAHPTVKIVSNFDLVAVACPSTGQCTAVLNGQTAVQQVTFIPTSGAVISGPTTIDASTSDYVSAVTCPSASDCVAVGGSTAVEGDPTSSASWTLEPIPAATSLNAVACPSVGLCAAVDQLGNAFVGITAPVNVSAPAISGSAVQGQTLTEAHGTWSPDPTGYTYEWQRCDSAGNACAVIAGATGQSYTLTSADVGSTIRVLETAGDSVGPSVPAGSAQTAVVTGVPVSTSPPIIAGTSEQGQTLSETHGSWSNSPTDYTYQWQRCDSAGNACAAIAGASGQSYILTSADVGATIRVQETASNSVGAGPPATSTPTAVVTAVGSGGGGGSSGSSRPVPPKVTGYRLTNNPFVVAAAFTPISANAATTRHKHGTTFKYTLSEPATVKIAISRRLPGRRHGKNCVAPTRKLRHAKACARILSRGTLTRTSHMGANSVAFSGRIGSRPLKPGRYQATLTATDSAKRASKPRTIYFTIATR